MDSQKRKHTDGCIGTEEHRSPSENFQDMSKYNSEAERLRTFVLWPSDSAVDPARLAKSGFCYTGKDDEVVCFSCQGHIKDWQYGDIVQRKHVELFPNCDFVNNKSTNVPLVNSRLTENDKISRRISEPTINNTSPITKVQKQLSVAEKYLERSPCSNEVKSRTTSSISLSLETLFQEMKSEEKRLRTFKNGWPVLFIDTKELACAGFFYLGSSDKVQCPFCGVIVMNWEVGDKPLAEHRRHFPECTYLSTLHVHRNCKLTGEISWFKGKGSDVCGKDEGIFMSPTRSENKLLDKSQEHTKLEDLGVSLHRGPAHPQQATLAARLRSYISWPETAPIKKEDLANAGFFYIGISDHTKCFHCDGGLCSWEEGDDPWVEHARWFCNCSFVRLNKGDDFIKSCIAKYPAEEPATKDRATDSSPMVADIITETEEAMKSGLIQAVLETGVFSPYLVRAAVMRQLKETGSLFTSVDDVCEAVAFLQHQLEKELPQQLRVDDSLVDTLNIKVTSVDKTGRDGDMQVVPHAAAAGEACKKPEKTEKKTVNIVKEPSGGNLEEENRFLKDQRLCKVCMDNEVGVVFLPCGHLLTCTFCAPALKLCPMCRKAIQATVRAYLP